MQKENVFPYGYPIVVFLKSARHHPTLRLSHPCVVSSDSVYCVHRAMSVRAHKDTTGLALLLEQLFAETSLDVSALWKAEGI